MRTTKILVAPCRGGADSDVMLDMLLRCGARGKTHFVFFSTGVEYKATYEQLDFLEKKYDITIERIKPVKTVPACCKEYGLPFLSKNVSELISRLQRHDFQYEDEPVDVLKRKYPAATSSVGWWCNARSTGRTNRYNIDRNKYLKEFLILNPPTFKIADKCCHYAKKLPSQHYEKEHDIDLVCTGVRKAEGGTRSMAFKNCFSYNVTYKVDTFRPLFFFRDADSEAYCKHYGVTHSRCYTEYGFKRTGCVGCPYNRNFEEDLEKMKQFEPNTYKLANAMFGTVYDYTRKYRAFQKEMKAKEKGVKGETQ